MSVLLTLIVVVAVAVVLIWLINQIPFPAGLEMLRFLGILIVVVLAILKLWPLLA